ILRVHPSNFRTLGFVEQVEIEALCALGPPVIDDVGSGALASGLRTLRDEPPVRRSVLAGAALVCFSGDKLLGGPQAGLLVGGGALPLLELEGPVVAIEPGREGVDALAARLRAGEPAVVGRIWEGRLLLDPRTLSDDEADAAAAALADALADG